MARDENLDIFVHGVFNCIWDIDSSVNCISPYQTGVDGEEIFNSCLFIAIFVAKFFYGYIFGTVFKKNFEYKKSKKKFCNYVRHMCNCESWFGKPSIFERILASLGFVVAGVHYSADTHTYLNLKTYAPTCWKIYFKRYIGEFYFKGGWKEFRRSAISYEPVKMFLRITSEGASPEILPRISKSIENYLYFIANSNSKIVSNYFRSLTFENGNQGKTLGILWIKFIVENCNEQSFDNACTQPPKNPSEVTCLLRILRYLCDPSKLKVRQFDLSLADGLEQETNEQTICSPEKIQEPCKMKNKNRNKGKNKRSDEKSNPNVTMGQACSSTINNRSLGKTAVENEIKDKDGCILKFTGGENETMLEISTRGIKDANVSEVKKLSNERNENYWSMQKKSETYNDYIHRRTDHRKFQRKYKYNKKSQGKCEAKSKEKFCNSS